MEPGHKLDTVVKISCSNKGVQAKFDLTDLLMFNTTYIDNSQSQLYIPGYNR